MRPVWKEADKRPFRSCGVSYVCIPSSQSLVLWVEVLSSGNLSSTFSWFVTQYALEDCGKQGVRHDARGGCSGKLAFDELSDTELHFGEVRSPRMHALPDEQRRLTVQYTPLLVYSRAHYNSLASRDGEGEIPNPSGVNSLQFTFPIS